MVQYWNAFVRGNETQTITIHGIVTDKDRFQWPVEMMYGVWLKRLMSTQLVKMWDEHGLDERLVKMWQGDSLYTLHFEVWMEAYEGEEADEFMKHIDELTARLEAEQQ